MRGDTDYKGHQKYRTFLKRLYMLMSCFTLLYFFVFTESYTRFQPVDLTDSSAKTESVESVGIAEQAAISGAASNYKWEQKAGSSKKTSETSKGKKLLPCGIPVGIYLETKGVLVTEVTEVTTSEGKVITPCDSLLEAGDYILKADGKEVTSKEQFQSIVKEGNGTPLQLTIEHNGKQKNVKIQPVLSDSGEYIAGLWIRDNMHGIGTMTWLDENGDFAALGHCISDIDTGVLLEMDQGQLYQAEIYSLIKGSSSHPGSLAGAIDYRMQSCIGTVKENTEQGIFGQGNKAIKNLILERLSDFYQRDSFEEIWQQGALETAGKEEIKNGKAQMLNCFNGEYELYDIEIKKAAETEQGYGNINLEITVTDSKLLKQTGGILQGMSGSPIIQDGKLIGAVTHVLVNDPTRGYGIFIENMLEAAE